MKLDVHTNRKLSWIAYRSKYVGGKPSSTLLHINISNTEKHTIVVSTLTPLQTSVIIESIHAGFPYKVFFTYGYGPIPVFSKKSAANNPSRGEASQTLEHVYVKNSIIS